MEIISTSENHIETTTGLFEWEMPTPNHVIEEDKFFELVASMKAEGWQGGPVLSCDGEFMTGSHRVAAAHVAGIEIEIEAAEDQEWFDSEAYEVALGETGYPQGALASLMDDPSEYGEDLL